MSMLVTNGKVRPAQSNYGNFGARMADTWANLGDIEEWVKSLPLTV